VPTKRQFGDTMEDQGFLRKEQDPHFFRSPASLITLKDIDVIRQIPITIKNIRLRPGQRGETGIRGVQGFSGIQGEVGEIGENGSEGRNGLDGLRGRQGLRGETGESGKDGIGIKGESGKDGKNITGKTGAKGKDGIDAESIAGKRGVRGLKGKDGITTTETRKIAKDFLQTHEDNNDHSLLHDSHLLGTKTINEKRIGAGKFLVFDGTQLVYEDPPQQFLGATTVESLQLGGSGMTTRGGKITAGEIVFGASGNLLDTDSSFTFSSGTVAATTFSGGNVTSGADPGHTHTSTSLPDVESLTTSLTAGSVVFSNGTNLAQDNANFFWDDSNNRLGIGTATPSGSIHVEQDTATNPLTFDVYANQAEGADINLRKSRGTSATPLTIVSGDTLGRIVFGRHNGTSFQNMALIAGVSDGAVSAGKLTFSTRTDSGAVGERMNIGNTGLIGMNVADPDATLEINTLSSSEEGLKIKASASQTANTFIITNSSDTTLSVFDEAGKLGIGIADPDTSIHVVQNIKLEDNQAIIWGAGAGGTDFQIGNGVEHRLTWATTSIARMSLEPAGGLLLNGANSNTNPFIIRGKSDMSVDLMRMEDSSSNAFFASGDGLATSSLVL